MSGLQRITEIKSRIELIQKAEDKMSIERARLETELYNSIVDCLDDDKSLSAIEWYFTQADEWCITIGAAREDIPVFLIEALNPDYHSSFMLTDGVELHFADDDVCLRFSGRNAVDITKKYCVRWGIKPKAGTLGRALAHARESLEAAERAAKLVNWNMEA